MQIRAYDFCWLNLLYIYFIFTALPINIYVVPPYFTGNEHKDWSWRVRFAAVQGLVRICRHCGGDSTKDGICGVAWAQLMRHHSLERDVRVLEAWKLAQVGLM